MGMMSPVFRELNYSRVKDLKACSLSDGTIAGIISDETGQDVSAQDVRSYLKMNALASEQMLVSKETMRVVSGNTPDENEPELA